jgi:IMP dehydrogenase
MAQQGGLGVVHKNLTIDAQAAEIDKVKRSESGMIVDPVTCHPEQPIHEALAVMRKYKISGVPIVDHAGKLVGILTNRDLRFEKDTTLPVSAVMTGEGLVTAPSGTTLAEAERLLHRHRIEKLPSLTRSSGSWADHGQGHPEADQISVRVQGRVGMAPSARPGNREGHARSRGRPRGCVDRWSWTPRTAQRGRAPDDRPLREKYPGMQLVGGNVATEVGRRRSSNAARRREGRRRSRSICTTRIVTGAGVPQVTATGGFPPAMRPARRSPTGIKFGTRKPAAGAHAVMIGSLIQVTKKRRARRSLSRAHAQGISRHGQFRRDAAARRTGTFRRVDERKMVPEGSRAVSRTRVRLALIGQLVGGLRGHGHTGCRDIERCDVTLISFASDMGLREPHAHDVIITKEAPN